MWFIIKNVAINKFNSQTDAYMEVENLNIGVSACQREINKEGILVDKKI